MIVMLYTKQNWGGGGGGRLALFLLHNHKFYSRLPSPFCKGFSQSVPVPTPWVSRSVLSSLTSHTPPPLLFSQTPVLPLTAAGKTKRTIYHSEGTDPVLCRFKCTTHGSAPRGAAPKLKSIIALVFTGTLRLVL